MLTTILGRLFAEKDGTFRLTDDGSYIRAEYENGYQVGGYVPTLTNPERATDLQNWIQQGRPELSGMNIPGSNLEIGKWTDADGNVHWDAGTRWMTLPSALRAGALRGEDCIWDWANGTTINVDGVDTILDPR